jgi:hypothetical protein
MRVTIEPKRVLHLIILIVLTVTFGRLLTERYEWKFLSAYGLTCSLVCQISNVIMKFHEVSGAIANNAVEIETTKGKNARAKKAKMKNARKLVVR